MNSTDINFSNFLLDKKIYKNILVYDVPYKTSMGLRIKSDKIDGFTMVLDGKIKHSVLLDYGNRFT